MSGLLQWTQIVLNSNQVKYILCSTAYMIYYIQRSTSCDSWQQRKHSFLTNARQKCRTSGLHSQQDGNKIPRLSEHNLDMEMLYVFVASIMQAFSLVF